MIEELLNSVAYIDRALSAPRGSLLLAGRAGVGRKSAVRIVSALHGAKLHTLKMGKNYSLKNFKNDLKTVSSYAIQFKYYKNGGIVSMKFNFFFQNLKRGIDYLWLITKRDQ